MTYQNNVRRVDRYIRDMLKERRRFFVARLEDGRAIVADSFVFVVVEGGDPAVMPSGMESAVAFCGDKAPDMLAMYQTTKDAAGATPLIATDLVKCLSDNWKSRIFATGPALDPATRFVMVNAEFIDLLPDILDCYRVDITPASKVVRFWQDGNLAMLAMPVHAGRDFLTLEAVLDIPMHAKEKAEATA